MDKKVFYLSPSSFCRGVERSIDELNKVLDRHSDGDVYCYHAVVHNPKVTQEFVDKGVTFVESLDEITNPDAIVTFSAHGINRAILDEAADRFQAVYNLECPLVTKIYRQIDMYVRKGVKKFFYIGQNHHQEWKNVIGYARHMSAEMYVFKNLADIPVIDDDTEFAVLSQTTLNYEHVKSLSDAIADRYPRAIFPPLTDICKATYDRQTVIIQNKDLFDVLVVIGGKESHNTKELVKLGEKFGKKTIYAETLEGIRSFDDEQLFASRAVAVTGGASTPVPDIKGIFQMYIDAGYDPKILKLEEVEGDYK